MPKSPFHIASKAIDDHSVITTSAVAIGCCVGYSGAQITASGSVVRGIAKTESAIKKTLNIATGGTVPAKIGGTVAVGDPLTSDSQGRLVVATAGQPIFARALQVGATDEFIEVFITREGKA